MAEPTFSINGGANLPGVSANWQRVVKRVNADGTLTYQPYARHVWNIAQMTMANFQLLQAQSGQVLTSLATTNINDRNNGATYTGAEMGPVNGEQVGQRMTNVTVEFRVDI